MKLILFSLCCIAFLSCKEVQKETKSETQTTDVAVEKEISQYPEALEKVFEKHGGLEAWKKKRVLSFEIPKPDNREKHTVDLYSRNEKIEMPKVSMGAQGNTFWLLDEEETYKGDAVFYHNLMFYFYAMPFVLADDGIQYEQAEPLNYEGVSYPGFKISYEDGIGLSSKDEYFIHYNAETYQMEWLGYTVTYKTGEKSDRFSWIRYNDWMDIEGVVLPKAISWHKTEDGVIKEVRNTLNFENVTIGESAHAIDFYAAPANAKIVSGKVE